MMDTAKHGSLALSNDQLNEILLSPGAQALCARDRDVLRLKLLEHGVKILNSRLPVNMSLERVKPLSGEILPCLTTKLTLFEIARRRKILGYEHFKVQMGIHCDVTLSQPFEHLQE